MIEVHNVTKRYGTKAVVDDVSLTIAKGGITSFIGPNGAGKSTLLAMISRLLPCDQGQVSIDGHAVGKTKSSDLAKKLSILKQENHISVRLTVRELVSFGRFPYSKGRLTQADQQHVDRALAYLELQGFERRYLDQLSGGQRQRAYVAMVLCQDTDYILLDEPLNNLDMKHSVQIMRVLRRMVTELGKTIVLVVHDINFASCHSDQIVALKDGHIVHQGPVDMAGFPSDKAGSHVKVFLPRPGQAKPLMPKLTEYGPVWPPADERPFARTYTIRHIDAAAGELELDFVLHGDNGPASAWAIHAKPGDFVGIAGPGPRGPITQTADWYIFAGDETAIPAISAHLERLPSGAQGVAFIEIADAAEEQPLDYQANIRLTWLHRNDTPAGQCPLLEESIRATAMPTGELFPGLLPKRPPPLPFATIGAKNWACPAIRLRRSPSGKLMCRKRSITKSATI